MPESPRPETTAYDGGQLFRIRHIEQPGRPNGKPYEFVDRVGAVTVLPITYIDNKVHALAITNTRAHYGQSYGLPSGNREGRFENPEPVIQTGLRELQEETGYGYLEDMSPDVDAFDLRTLSNTIRYTRSFMVARNVIEIGGKQDNPREYVVPQPLPLEEFTAPLFEGGRTETYPEINAAFMRAGMLVGQKAVLDWLQYGENSAHAVEVTASFAPWLQPAN